MKLPSQSFVHFGGLLAHVGHSESSGFLSGMAHPVLGLDHLVAMVCVGLLSLQVHGRVSFKIPLLFLATLLLGGGAGHLAWLGEPLEALLALSVCALGLALLFPERVKGGFLLELVVGITAFLHGYAHGAEAPDGHVGGFFVGFAVGTIVLMTAGLLASLALYELADGTRIRRSLGGLAGCAGLFFLIRVLTT